MFIELITACCCLLVSRRRNSWGFERSVFGSKASRRHLCQPVQFCPGTFCQPTRTFFWEAGRTGNTVYNLIMCSES